MYKTLAHYINVYKLFMSNSTTMAMSFRAHFILLIIMDVAFYIISITSIGFIYNHVTHIGPWNKNQLLFFLSYMLAINNLQMTSLATGHWSFPELIRTGELDYYLIKPIGTIFNVFFRFFRPSGVFNGIVVSYLMIKYGMTLNLSIYQWLMIPPVFILSFILFIEMEIIISCGMFWMVEGLGINFLRMQFQTLSRYPDFIYMPNIRLIFSRIFPILLIGSASIKFILDFSNWHLLLIMSGFIIVFGIILRIIWNFGLNFYDSASS